MNAHRKEVPDRADRRELPEFEVECIFDDVETPTEVTIFSPETERTLTEWVSAKTSDAVDLSGIR